MGNYRSRPPITPGTGLSGMAGGVLIILFFTPWLSACNYQFTGADLAFGANFAGMQSEATHPWLALIPLMGLIALGAGVWSLINSRSNARVRSMIVAIVGAVALVLLVLLGVGIVIEAGNAETAAARDLVGFSMQYGYFLSIFAALGVIGGGLLDMGIMGSARAQPAYRQPQQPLKIIRIHGSGMICRIISRSMAVPLRPMLPRRRHRVMAASSPSTAALPRCTVADQPGG